MDSSRELVQKLWSYCHVLRDEGVSTLEYVEQLTYLLFLKMAQERTQPPWNQPSIIPAGLDWPSLLDRTGDDLEVHYRHVLGELGREPGMLGAIFRKAQNRIQDPAKLQQIIHDLIDKETWSALDADVKGDAYEGLLARGVADGGSGAGQYFTPRPLIRAIVRCMQPSPDMTVCDPAAGTAGFLLAAHEYMADPANYSLDRDQRRYLQEGALRGWEIVDGTARLALMNLLLHGVGRSDGPSPITVDDALRSDPGERFDQVLTNPPFGKKSSTTVVGADGATSKARQEYHRDDFWVTTANKQLNFVQHVRTLLKVDGSAAIVVPDNVLFEGGAGERVRRKLLHECDVHTLLRLPTGIFYAPGVKANMLFFTRRRASEQAATHTLWVYDMRTNNHFTLKTQQLKEADLEPFIQAYQPGAFERRTEDERFRAFSYDEVLERDKVNLDITWLQEESHQETDELPDPDALAAEIADDLEAAAAEFAEIASNLQS